MTSTSSVPVVSSRALRKSGRLLYKTSDALTEALIYFAIVFGPWAFGTTQDWAIEVMNWVGCSLGALFLVKLLVRSVGYRPLRWATLPNKQESKGRGAEKTFTRVATAGTLLVLFYCLVSAWNARAIFHADGWNFQYRQIISWLPHSYDQAASWAAFWKLLGWAGLFWGLRDWLLTLSPGEIEQINFGEAALLKGSRLPTRLRRLFTVLALNGTVLAVQGLMQRTEGGNRLLWLVVPRYDKEAVMQFGPYAYRASAAQYFNLLWPALLGFWWASLSYLRRYGGGSGRRGRVAVLLPCILVMALCPLVSSNRGGFMVLAANLVMSAAVLLTAQWKSHWAAKAAVLFALVATLGGGLLLGWRSLAPRMEMLQQGYENREALYLAGHYMAQDNALFGTGPGSFDSTYQFYRRAETDERLAYMHNDWLETVITFGWLGAIPIFLMLFWTTSHWFRAGGIYGNKYFVMLLWVALGGCLVHACFDFPFQIHSVATLFLILCAVLSCLSRHRISFSE